MFWGPKFNPDKDIPDLSGKVILVTGANVGLGKETVLQLAKHNPARIFLASRSEANAHAAIEDIEREVPGSHKIVTFLQLDLTSFDSIKRAAAAVASQVDRLDLLVNNAGIMTTPAGQTKEGYELQFGVNHMGHALLTRLLLPLLKRTAATGADVRVVNISSAGEEAAPKAGWPADMSVYKTDMADVWTLTRYGASKLANIHFTKALQRRNPDIKCVAVHPGVVATSLSRGLIESYPWLGWLISLFIKLVALSPRTAACYQLWACTSPDVKPGEFYHPLGVTGKGSALSSDEAQAERLWEWTEKELDAYV